MGLCWWWRKVRGWEAVLPWLEAPLSLEVEGPSFRLPALCSSLNLYMLLPQSPLYQALPLFYSYAGPPQLGAFTVLLLRAGFYAFSFLSVAMGSTIYYQGKCE